MINQLILFLLIFISGGIIVTIDYADYFYVPFILLLMHQILYKELVRPKKTLVPLFLLGSLFILLLLFRSEKLFFGNNHIIILKIITSIIFVLYVKSSFKSYTAFARKLVNVIELIIYLSLFTFLIMNLVPSLTFNVSEEVRSFLAIGYYRSFDFNKYGFIRNQGIFWEPGVLGVMIIIGFLHKQFFLKSRSNNWPYVLGVLSTFSFGSILIFIAIYYAQAINSARKNNPLVFVLFSGSFLITLIMFMSFPTDSILLIGELLGRDLANDSSAFTRYYDLYYGTKAGLMHPWIGNGADFGNFYQLTLSEINRSKQSYDGGITNSIVSMFYCYGAIFLFFYLHQLYCFSKNIGGNLFIFVFLALIFSLMLEPLHLSLLFLLIVGSSQLNFNEKL